jgi:formylglycine-generating enzyme required for sulfatase activity
MGLKKPNPWGLFDVYGNALEWCHNGLPKIDPSQQAAPVRDDFFQTSDGHERILRGGGYRYTPREVRSAKIFRMAPDAKISFLGFRVARTVKSFCDSSPKSTALGDPRARNHEASVRGPDGTNVP